MSLHVKNWRSFQHYQSRRPPWIKLHRTLLDDYAFIRLPAASQALALRLWLLASESEDGTIPSGRDELAFRLHCSESDVENCVKPLIDSGFLEGNLDASNTLAPRKQDATLETEGETEGRQRESPASMVLARGNGNGSLPPLPHPPEQRAEEATDATIRRLQLDLGARIARLAEHPNSRQMVPAWSREVTAYTRSDGTPVRGVADYRTVHSIDRLERSIEDAQWWWEQMEAGKVVGAGVTSGAR